MLLPILVIFLTKKTLSSVLHRVSNSQVPRLLCRDLFPHSNERRPVHRRHSQRAIQPGAAAFMNFVCSVLFILLPIEKF